jgi:hypothetical protein
MSLIAERGLGFESGFSHILHSLGMIKKKLFLCNEIPDRVRFGVGVESHICTVKTDAYVCMLLRIGRAVRGN